MSRPGGSRGTRALYLLLLGMLLAVTLWRGHTLIEQGSRPPEPTPAPPPSEITVLVTLEDLSPADLRELARPFERRGWTVCTGSLDAAGLWEQLSGAAGDAAGRIVPVVVAGPGPQEMAEGTVVLHHREAPGAVSEARRRLDAAAGEAALLWLHLRDLELPPPRPRAARRFLRRRGLKLPPAPAVRDALAGGAPLPEGSARALEALHRRGLSAVRRALGQLLPGGVRWRPSVVVVTGIPGSRRRLTQVPMLVAAPGDLPGCPEREDILRLLAGGDQKTWPMPR